MSRLAGIVLAAGPSARLGQPKQLLALHGRPLAVRVAELASQLCDAGVVVVTGAYHDEVVDALQPIGVTAVYNPRWQEGMGASLRQGAGAIGGDADAVMVMLADQPFVDRQDLERLVTSFESHPDRIAAAAYADITGVPAIFPRRYLDALKKLSGDQGARVIIAREPDVFGVPMANAEFDVDTPQALADMNRKAGRHLP